MILAEQLVLLALDPERGRIAPGIAPERLRTGAVAALLAELVLHGRLAETPQGLVLDDTLPDFHPMLAATSRAFGREALTVPDALRKVERASGALVRRLIASLVARDILHDYRQAFFFHHYPVRSMQALREVFASIHAVTTAQPHATGAFALAAIADATGVFEVRLTAEERVRTRRHLEEETRRAHADVDAERNLRLILHLAEATAAAHP
jgi:hypothetical protein